MEQQKSEHIFGGGVKPLTEIWAEAWSAETHTTEFAQKRIKSAKSSKTTPVKVDKEDLYGYFQGSSGRYETFLDNCPCGDFRRYNLPCKHIYRLAIELGVMDEQAQSDTRAILAPRKERYSIDEQIDSVEELTEDEQKHLKYIAGCVSNENPILSTKVCEELKAIIEKGIVEDVTQGGYRADYGKRKANITSFLDENGISYKKSDSLKILYQLCEDNAKEKALEHFGMIADVKIADRYTPRTLYYYLHRKHDTECYYDGHQNIQEIKLTDTILPDDNITEQLIKRGYYKR